jgi:hypothetical protein
LKQPSCLDTRHCCVSTIVLALVLHMHLHFLLLSAVLQKLPLLSQYQLHWAAHGSAHMLAVVLLHP